ncbi:MAG: hypothetical protein PVF51_11455 [Nitrospirota bacterium]|jgi:hypothetical protein
MQRLGSLPATAALTLLVGGLLAAAPRTAGAVPVTYIWTGAVSFIDPVLAAEGPSFAVDDPVVMAVTIDDGTVGNPLSSGDATTYSGIDAFSLTLGDDFEMAGGLFDFVGSITVQDAASDAFRIDRQALPSTPVPPDLGIYRPTQVIAVLRDSTGAVFSSQALPTSLALEDFTSTELTLIYRDPSEFSTFANVGIRVEGVSVTVPEPRPAALGILALAFVLAQRRRARRLPGS